MDRKVEGYASLTGAFVLAGTSVVAGKLLAGLPVFFAAAGGAVIAAIGLVPMAVTEKKPRRGALLASLPLLAAQAFFGVALFRILMLAALSRVTASEAGVATSVTPVITAVLAALFLKERIRAGTAIGIGLAVAGIAVLESGGTELGGSGRFLGCLLALGAAASESIFNVLSKRLDASIGPRRASAIVMAIAFVFLALLSLFSGEKVEWRTIGTERILAFAYQGLFASALAYICWFAGIARVAASTAGAFSGLIPVSSFALSGLVLGEKPGGPAYFGCALAIGGIILCATPKKEAAARRLKLVTPTKP